MIEICTTDVNSLNDKLIEASHLFRSNDSSDGTKITLNSMNEIHFGAPSYYK